MRIYAVADIHGKPERMRRIRRHVHKWDPDVLVAAGDITQFTGARRVLSQLDSLTVPILAVRGNTDRPHMEKCFSRFARITPIHLRKVHIKRTPFVGLSGTTVLPFRSFVGCRETELFSRVAPLLDRQTVLVAHPPPWGVLDEVLGRFHTGSRRLRQVLVTCRPQLVLFGHIHERAGHTRLGGTAAVNCTMGNGGSGALIDIIGGQLENIRVL